MQIQLFKLVLKEKKQRLPPLDIMTYNKTRQVM